MVARVNLEIYTFFYFLEAKLGLNNHLITTTV